VSVNAFDIETVPNSIIKEITKTNSFFIFYPPYKIC